MKSRNVFVALLVAMVCLFQATYVFADGGQNGSTAKSAVGAVDTFSRSEVFTSVEKSVAPSPEQVFVADVEEVLPLEVPSLIETPVENLVEFPISSLSGFGDKCDSFFKRVNLLPVPEACKNPSQ